MTDPELVEEGMTPLDIRPNLPKTPWAVGELMAHAPLDRIGLVPVGTTSGRATVQLMGRVAGRPVVFETTYRLLRLAMLAFGATATGLLAEEEEDRW